ncbi:hypothetical protein C5S39_10130 [Candidatus Methanophagaceae archaeon]|nr:hypothetical protein C5S39_10130 [Methanophagales archaeon]
MEAAPDIRNFAPVKAVPSDIEKVGNIEIILFDAADMAAVIDAIRTLRARVIRTSGDVIIAYTDLKNVPQIAAITQVREVNHYHEPALCNNVATGIIRANILHNNHELDGA